MALKFNNRKKKVSLSQVVLKDYLEFYRNDICSNSYIYTLENDLKIIIKFEETSFSHLLGLHKFKRISSYKKSKDINNDIYNSKLKFKDLYKLEPKALNTELRDRVTYFPILKTLLENTSIVLEYNINAILNTKIKFSFLLKTDEISVIIYLAVREIKNGQRICVPVSFLVDRKNMFSKMKLKELKIIKIEVE